MTAEIFVLADKMDKILKVQCSLVSDGKFTIYKFSINKLMCSLISSDNTTNPTNNSFTENLESTEGNIFLA